MLTAINSGGNNLARGTLTGALSGAQTGLSGIPERFITGFKDYPQWVNLAIDIACRSIGLISDSPALPIVTDWKAKAKR